MLQTISSVGGFKVGSELEKYVAGKLEDLEKEIPRSLRRYAHAEIQFEQHDLKGKRLNKCELNLRLPREAFAAVESTQHVYSAVDIAIAHVREQLVAYKALQPHPIKRQLRRLKRSD